MTSNKEHKKLDPKKIKINISSFSNKLVHFNTKRINNWKITWKIGKYFYVWRYIQIEKEYKYVEHNFSRLQIYKTQ